MITEAAAVTYMAQKYINYCLKVDDNSLIYIADEFEPFPLNQAKGRDGIELHRNNTLTKLPKNY